MFNWQGIAQQVADYTFCDDKFAREVCEKLYVANPEAQSVDDFEQIVFYDAIFAVEEEYIMNTIF